MEVVVAGGGIAGLTMALTCHQIGVPVGVFEVAPELRPLGLGINLQPEAVRELFELGLEPELAALGLETRELAFVDRAGNDIWSEPRGRDAGNDWPQYSVHRGELQMMLLRAVVDRLGPDAVATGRRVTQYEHVLDGVSVDIESRHGGLERIEASVLLGADGLHSAVRARMFPGDGGPRWGGSVLWRGISSGRSVRTGSSFVVVGDSTQRFSTFPISAPDPDTGHQRHNWIAEIAFDSNHGWRRGDWNTRVPATEFVDAFADWTFDWLDIPTLVNEADDVFEYPMVDRDPVDHWVHGSVALLGDAAHPMYPVGSNGASQAIVDARVLGAAFDEHGVGREALRAYETKLLETRSALVLRNRTLGPASVLGIVDDRLAEAFARLDEASPHERARIIADYRTFSSEAIARLNRSAPTIPSPNQPPVS